MKLLRPIIPSNIDIKINIKSSSSVLGNPIQLHQVIVNLFTNALYAIGDNVGTFELELQDFYIDSEYVKYHTDFEVSDYILIRISYTGCGISPDVIENNFDPSYTTKQQGIGTGLGLSFIHGIVKKLKGM